MKNKSKKPPTCRAKFLAATEGRRVQCVLPIGHGYPTHMCPAKRGGLIEWGRR